MRRKTPGQLGVFLLKVALSLAGPDFGLAAMMTNESYLFNYYVIRTPGRGYLSAGVNYSNPKWVDGTAPTMTGTPGKYDLLNFYYDGTNYLGSYTQNY